MRRDVPSLRAEATELRPEIIMRILPRFAPTGSLPPGYPA